MSLIPEDELERIAQKIIRDSERSSKWSWLQRRALKYFVTHPDAPVYGLLHPVRGETGGAAGSYFSRNPRDVRDHLIDFASGQASAAGRIDKIKGNLQFFWNFFVLAPFSRDPSRFLESGLKKSQRFFEFWFGRYGHKSVGDTVKDRFVANNISQLVARELAFDPLISFIEQSTRYVHFDSETFYRDPEIMASDLGSEYEDTVRFMMQAYEKALPIAKRWFISKMPFERFVEEGHTNKKTLRGQKADYDRMIQGQALDVVRYLLPQATMTNIYFVMSGREEELNISKWLSHPLQEVQIFGKLFEIAAKQLSPSLIKYAGRDPYYADMLAGYDGAFNAENHFEPDSGKYARLTMINHDALDEVVAFIMKRLNHGSLEHFRKLASSMPYDQKVALLKRTVEKRGEKNEHLDEAFRNVQIGVEIKTDVGALRDLRRHRRCVKTEERYTLRHGIYIPDSALEMGLNPLFEEVGEKAMQFEEKARDRFPFAYQYAIPMATMFPLHITMDLAELAYMEELRTGPGRHFSYHQDMHNVHREVTKVLPWLEDIIRIKHEEPGLHK
ncbi:hypothetical protein D6745_03615 [Candidatus Woesearchaeota archaeon]|nr:MAG: hypothetical protein D6745_03615 [Candidatus Woesearchaeota archaeon]